MSADSLAQKYAHRREISIALWAAGPLLLAGYVLPFMQIERLSVWSESYNILQGIWGMFGDGEYLLGTIILLFTVLFPIVKLTWLVMIWRMRMDSDEREALLMRLHHLGKWSMLDVFVLALMLVMTKSSFLVRVEPRAGAFCFAGAILLSMAVTMRIDHLRQKSFKRST